MLATPLPSGLTDGFKINIRGGYACYYFSVGPKADCGPLEDPENGKVNMDQGTLAGSYAIYVCDPGYKLVGFLDFRVCQHDGFWSNTKIRCEPIGELEVWWLNLAGEIGEKGSRGHGDIGGKLAS